MFRIEDVLQPKDGEKVRALVRRHVATLIPSLFLSLVLIVVPFFLLFPLFSWGIPGVILFFFSVVAGIVIAIRSLLLWDADVLIVTTMRLIDVDQQGLLTRTVSEAALGAVQDVSWKRAGLADTMFKMGCVKIQTASTTTTIEAKGVPKPESIFELINELRHDAPSVGSGSAPKNEAPGERRELLESIRRMLEPYSFEELQRVETVLKARERSSLRDAFLGEEKEESEEAVDNEDEAEKT
jgi:membrane protein YdbS with pleckstrin-like domain